MYGFRTGEVKLEGKAWIGGLACSELAGYQACRAGRDGRNERVIHFFPLNSLCTAIIPKATDKLRGVAVVWGEK